MSFLKKLRDAEAEAAPQDTDPWRLRLERLRGKVDFDGMERVSTQHLLDVLEVPQRERTAGAYRHLAKLMAELGWTAVRVRDLTRGGYKEQVRGYVRKNDDNVHLPNQPIKDRMEIIMSIQPNTAGPNEMDRLWRKTMTEQCALVEGPVWARYEVLWPNGCWRLRKPMSYGPKPSIIAVSTSGSTDCWWLISPTSTSRATVLLSRLEQNLASLVVDLNGEVEPEEFAMMVGMGFFVLTGRRYQMVIPTRLTLGKVMNAALEIGKNRRRGILPASRIHHHDDALRESQGMAKLAYVKWTRRTVRPIECCCSV